MLNKPRLEDYGVTQKEYNEYISKRGKTNFDLIDAEYGEMVRAMLVVFSMLFPVSIIIDDASNIDAGEWIGVPIVLILSGLVSYLLIAPPITKLIIFLASLIPNKPIEFSANLGNYLKAEDEYNRELKEQERFEKEKLEREKARLEAEKRRDINYWKSFVGKGIEFENEIKRFYEELGYKVKKTPASGDEGVDLILDNGEEEIFVQCKAQKEKLPPKAVREFYGAFRSRTQKGIIVTVNGVSENAYEWARNKNIEFLDVDGIIELRRLRSEKE